jgi:hypothetical protein
MKNGPSPLRARSTSFLRQFVDGEHVLPVDRGALSMPKASARAMMEPAAISSVLVYSE